MLDRLKTYLGVEGVRLELDVPVPPKRKLGIVAGTVSLSTLREQRVRTLSLRLTERYTRGRGERRRIDEYVLGQSEVTCDLAVVPGEAIDIPFTLHFAERRTPLEAQLQGLGPLATPLTKLAFLTHAAKSTYELSVTAAVSGVALEPACTIAITLA